MVPGVLELHQCSAPSSGSLHGGVWVSPEQPIYDRCSPYFVQRLIVYIMYIYICIYIIL